MKAAPSSLPHYPGLDTLRALAIALVMLSHARAILKWGWLRAPGAIGWCGVDLFFVLSGFLIGSQLLDQARAAGRVDFRRFYARRAFRILPSYLVVLALYYAWPAFNEAKGIDPPWKFLSFTLNFGRRDEGFSHAWSLCVEEHFYLVLPALTAVFLGRRRRLRPSALLALVVAGGILLRAGLTAAGADFWAEVYRPTYCRLDGLTAGVGLALLRSARPASFARVLARPWLLAGGGLGVLAFGLWVYDGNKGVAASAFGFPLVALGFAGLVAAAMAPDFWLGRRWPGAATVATASYALYLTHKQTLHFAATFAGRDGPVALGVAAVILTAGMAALLHFGVERPALALRRRWELLSADRPDLLAAKGPP